MKELFDSIQDMVFILDLQGNIIHFNNIAQEKLKYNEHDLIGNQITDLLLLNEKEKVLDRIRNTSKEIPNIFEHTLISKDKKIINVSTKIFLNQWNNTDVIFCISRDITDKKNVDTKQNNLDLVLKGTLASVWDYDIRNRKVHHKKLGNHIFDLKHDNKIIDAESWMERIHPEDLERVRSAFLAHLKGKKSFFEAEFRMRNNKGEWLWFLSRAKVVEYSAQGEPLHVIGNDINITSRKDTEARLLFRESFEDMLIRLSAEFINLQSQYIDRGINQALKILGEFSQVDRAYVFLIDETKEFISNTHEWYANNLDSRINRLQKLPVNGVAWWEEKLLKFEPIHVPSVKEIPLMHTKERNIFLQENIQSLIAVPMINEDTLIGYFGFDSVKEERKWDKDSISLLKVVAQLFVNALRRKEYEDRLRTAKEEAEQANKAKSVFLANISHELRTPMNAIIGISEMLFRNESDSISDEHASKLQLINQSGKKLLLMINDLLDLSKIEATKMEQHEETFSINEFIKHLSNMTYGLIGDKNIKFLIETDMCSIDIITTDRGKLNHILTNILGNAVKFTDSGKITLNISLKDKKRLLFIVTDTGIGIGKEEVPYVFDKFKRTSTSFKNKFEGSGLGLSLCKKLITFLGGKIWIKSELNKGTSISFSISVKQEKTNQNKDNTFTIIEPDKKNILIADDDEIGREVFKMMLESEYNLSFAENGQEAVEKAITEDLDMILMDIMMPVIDGFEALTKIRELNISKEIPIIAVTARASTEARKELLDYGFDEYISKPFDYETLLSIVKEQMKA